MAQCHRRIGHKLFRSVKLTLSGCAHSPLVSGCWDVIVFICVGTYNRMHRIILLRRKFYTSPTLARTRRHSLAKSVACATGVFMPAPGAMNPLLWLLSILKGREYSQDERMNYNLHNLAADANVSPLK